VLAPVNDARVDGPPGAGRRRHGRHRAGNPRARAWKPAACWASRRKSRAGHV